MLLNILMAVHINYVVMGDSTAAGVGAAAGEGIAAGTAQHLGLTSAVTLTNLGVSGAKIGEVVTGQLPSAVAQHPDVVLLAAGANDVTHLTSIRAMRRSLLDIVHGLRAANGGVVIVLTGSPDMGAPPRVPWLLRPVAAWRTRAVNRMFVDVARAEGLTLAPIAEESGPLFRKDHSYFAADRFHPNARGYAVWTAILDRAFDEALARRPRTL